MNFPAARTHLCALILGLAQAVVATAQTAAPPGTPLIADGGAAPASGIPALVIEPGKNTVNAMQWISGCWQSISTRDGSTSNEIWLSPRAGTALGMGQTFRDTRNISWEAMRLYDEGETVKLWLRPGSRTESVLTLVAAGEKFATFSLKEGEIVTTLRYDRRSETQLAATLRIEQGGRNRGADYLFTRQECSAMYAPVASGPAAKQ